MQTMFRIDSPYFVEYYDSFVDEQRINLIIEFCTDGDLYSLLEKSAVSPLGDHTIWKIFINMCLGLEHLHSLNFIHRDLKSLNIFLQADY